MERARRIRLLDQVSRSRARHDAFKRLAEDDQMLLAVAMDILVASIPRLAWPEAFEILSAIAEWLVTIEE